MGRFRATGRITKGEDPFELPIPTVDIKDWLKDGGKLVTRRELWDFIRRLEHGRARAHSLPRRIAWVWQRAWSYLKRSPLETSETPKDAT